MQPVIWFRKQAYSVEYCHPVANDDGFVLTGTVVLLLDGLPATVSYRVACDAQWRTRSATIHQERAGEEKSRSLTVGEKLDWRADGVAVPFALGLQDVDLEITPASNTLPIRRLALAEGESRPIDAVWVRFPSLRLEPIQQRYTRLGPTLYRYENPSSGFAADLEVDEFGLVVRYGDLWRRVG